MITPISLNIQKPIQINNPAKPDNITFKGLKDRESKALFVFDLDGTLATANNSQLSSIFEAARKSNSKIVYATGRTRKEVIKLQQKLEQKGVRLPDPDYLVANNGQFLFENIDGVMVENTDYQDALQAKTHYDRYSVKQAMKEIAKSDKYKYSAYELSKLENLDEVKESDPEYYDSRISYYEWNASRNMAEYFLSYDVDTKELKKEIEKKLSEKGIKAKFRENHYTKPIMDACRNSILLQSNSLRRHKDGSMTALFLCAADKSDGIEFIRKQNNISYDDVLMAGNDDNDIPMVNLCQKGAKFICLNDSSLPLFLYCSKIKDNVLMAFKNGAEAIIEGIEYFTQI